jgi:hypothetical protein
MKKFVIDGHNLIPKVSGIRLSDPEDENRLIEMLNEYCRLSRTQVEVFFDGAPAPGKPIKKSGSVHVHFIRMGLTADDAIITYVRDHHRPESLLTVVSSDHRVQNSIKSLRAESMSSESFYAEMQRVFSSPQAARKQKEKQLTETEVQQWLEEFNSNQSG